MTVIAVTSAKGSPGVTTLCLAMTWVWPAAFPGRQVLLIDADPAGSGIAFGYLRGSHPAPGLGAVGLTGARGLQGADLWNQLISLDDDRCLLLEPTDPAQVIALEPVWQRLAIRLAEPLTWDGRTPVDVIVDTGRMDASVAGHPLHSAADVLLLAVRPSLASVATVRPALARTAASGRDVRLVLIGDRRPYRHAEVASALHCNVAGVIADDPRAAATFSEGSPPAASFKRSALLRSARQLAESLADMITSPAPEAAHG